MCEEPEPYRGPFVVLEPDPLGYRVSVDPPVHLNMTRTYRTKDAAWGYARDLWTMLHCPFRDLTDHNTARNADFDSSEKSDGKNPTIWRNGGE
jgi:hypothetical protein